LFGTFGQRIARVAMAEIAQQRVVILGLRASKTNCPSPQNTPPAPAACRHSRSTPPKTRRHAAVFCRICSVTCPLNPVNKAQAWAGLWAFEWRVAR
jgi:hypothetical protein